MTENNSSVGRAKWYVRRGERIHGPFFEEHIRAGLKSGKITPAMFIKQNESDWLPSLEVEERFRIFDRQQDRLSTGSDRVLEVSRTAEKDEFASKPNSAKDPFTSSTPPPLPEPERPYQAVAAQDSNTNGIGRVVLATAITGTLIAVVSFLLVRPSFTELAHKDSLPTTDDDPHVEKPKGETAPQIPSPISTPLEDEDESEPSSVEPDFRPNSLPNREAQDAETRDQRANPPVEVELPDISSTPSESPESSGAESKRREDAAPIDPQRPFADRESRPVDRPSSPSRDADVRASELRSQSLGYVEDSRLVKLSSLHSDVLAMYATWRPVERLASQTRAALESSQESCKRHTLRIQTLQANAQRNFNDARTAATDNKESYARMLQSAGIRDQMAARNLNKTMLQPEMAKQRQIQASLRKVQQKLTELTVETNQLTDPWFKLCDPFGRCAIESHQDGIRVFSEWIRRDPDLALPYLARGFGNIRLEDYAAAISDFDNAVLRNEILAPYVAAAKGYALVEMGDTRQGMKFFAAAQKYADKTFIVRLFWAWAYESQGRLNNADKEFRLALRKDGAKSPMAHEVYARYLIRRGGKGSSIDHAQIACDLAFPNGYEKIPNDGVSWIYFETLADAHAERESFNDAKKYIAMAIKNSPQVNHPQLFDRLSQYKRNRPRSN